MMEHALLQQLINNSIEEKIYQAVWDKKKLPFLQDYQILGYLFFPGAGYIEVAYAAAKSTMGNQLFSLKNMQIKDTLYLHSDESCMVTVKISKNEKIDIYSQLPTSNRITHHASMIIEPIANNNNDLFTIAKTYPLLNSDNRIGQTLYDKLRQFNIYYGSAYQTLCDISLGENIAFATFKNIVNNENFYSHPTLLYSCFQLFTFFLAKMAINNTIIYLPFGIKKIYYVNLEKPGVSAFVKLDDGNQNDELLTFDIFLLNEDYQIVIKVEGFQVKAHRKTSLNEKMKHKSEQETNTTHKKFYEMAQKLLSKPSHTDIVDEFEQLSALILVISTRIINVFD